MVKNVALFLTDKCNFNCSYCLVKKGNGVASFEVLDKAIKLVNDLEVEHLAVFGGEPLLAVDELEYLLKNIKCKVVVTTNGSIYNDKVKALLKYPNLRLRISLDGFDQMFRSDRQLWDEEYMKDGFICGASLTISKDNINHLFVNFEWLVERGYKEINCSLVREKAYSEADIKAFDTCLQQIIAKKSDVYFSLLDSYNTDKISCSLGNSFVINYDGEIYLCPGLIGHKEFYQGKIENFTKIDFKYPEKCYSCKYKDVCLYCPASRVETGNDYKTIDEDFEKWFCKGMMRTLFINKKRYDLFKLCK